MNRLVARCIDAGFTGRLLATILVSSSGYTVWPLYLRLRQAWSALDLVPAYTWVVSAIYFAFWVWLVVLLTREGKRYPGIILDAICGGALVTVAVAVHDPRVRSGLSEIGFGAAAWVAFLSGAALVLGKALSGATRSGEQLENEE